MADRDDVRSLVNDELPIRVEGDSHGPDLFNFFNKGPTPRYFGGFVRLPKDDWKECIGRKDARNNCMVCGIHEKTETLQNAHIHPSDIADSDLPSKARVFRLCRNHHAMYDASLVSTNFLIECENRWVSEPGNRPISSEFDSKIEEQVRSGRLRAYHRPAHTAVATKSKKRLALHDKPAQGDLGD